MALITDMGVTGNGIWQPKLKNRWRVDFIGLNGNDGQGLTTQAITCELPKLEYEEVQLDRYNSRAFVAAKHNFQPINIVFEDDVGGLVVTAIQQQSERQQKIIGVSAAPLLPASAAGQLYKFGTRIQLLDGEDTVFAAWALEGCFLQNLDYGDLDYAVSESLKVTATVRFDHARTLITGIKYKAHNGPTPF